MTFEQLFGALVVGEGSRPFVTYYDEATGERSELSVRSLANWVAKTHHLLVDELGLGVGDTALIDLPQHWLSVPILLGCATAGLAVADRDDGDHQVVFSADRALVAVPGVDSFVVDAAAALRGRAGEPPEGSRDYTASVRPHPDAWATVLLAATPADPFAGGAARADNVDTARRRADEVGLGERGRLLSTRTWSGHADWIDTLFSALTVGGSVVYLAGADDATVARRAGQERATAIVR